MRRITSKSKIAAIIIGFLALIWFLVRVIPKPSRAAYPCQRTAFPLASAFVIWVTGSLLSGKVFKKARISFSEGRKSKALVLAILALVVFIISVFSIQLRNSALSATRVRALTSEARKLYQKEAQENVTTIASPKSVVGIIRSERENASDITYEDIETMVHKAILLAGGFEDLIHEGDLVLLKPNVGASRTYGAGYEDHFPPEANGVATDYRIVQVVVNMVRQRNRSGKIILLEGSGYGLTRKNMDALSYNTISGLDSIICLDENIPVWYDRNSSDLVRVSLPEGKNLYSQDNEYFLNKTYYEADVIISIPCLKSHFVTGITGSVKNVALGAAPIEMYGSGPDAGEDYLVGRWNLIDHGDFSTQSTPLDKWIHDFYLCKPVNYVIMDGLQGAEYGPYPGSNSSHTLAEVQKNLKVIIAGSDPLAVDAIEALITGFDPLLIGHLSYLATDSAGCINSSLIKIKGTQVHEIKSDFQEDMPGKQYKYSDFTPPENVTITSWNTGLNTIHVTMLPNDDIFKIEVANDTVIFDPIVTSGFTDFSFPCDAGFLDPGKIRILVYDKYLNCTTLTLDSSTNVHIPESRPFKMYPNPATTVFSIEFPDQKQSGWLLSVSTQDGRLVLQKKILSFGKDEIDISHLKPGIYLVTLTEGRQIYQSKLLKIKY